MLKGDIVVSVASQVLIVGAVENQPLAGFTGYLKSVFLFDVALSKTDLNYLMMTKEVIPKSTGDGVTRVSTPVTSPVQKTIPKPHLYRKDRLENLVSARQAIDSDGDEYNAQLPTVDDGDLLSVELKRGQHKEIYDAIPGSKTP
ncbi:Hypothetical protein PHPALM_16286 [Phytophthora palmivora]|uniref:Uncharacterized protein n=1 Tax=Phytophthora palmivora TaxID=4796 RepID=A0A2P4XQA5_9STRA|nr:Hypothetical protein PHPALM_16286 [Phytophthora palmivora]